MRAYRKGLIASLALMLVFAAAAAAPPTANKFEADVSPG